VGTLAYKNIVQLNIMMYPKVPLPLAIGLMGHI